MTRLEEHGISFIKSEYAFLQLEKSSKLFLKEIDWQIKQYGWKHGCKLYHYLKDHRIKDLPESIRAEAKDDLETARDKVNIANGTIGAYNPEA